MNQKVLLGGIAALSGCAGIAAPIAAIKLQNKVTGKPTGCIGSIAHVATNDKIENKLDCFKEMNKEALKDNFKLVAATGAAAGAGAIATVASPTVKGAVKNLISKTGKALSNVSVSGKTVKDLIKSTKVFSKFNALPTPAKAAVLAGGAVFATGLALLNNIASAKAGYIEAKHEAKEENIQEKLDKAQKVVVY